MNSEKTPIRRLWKTSAIWPAISAAVAASRQGERSRKPAKPHIGDWLLRQWRTLDGTLAVDASAYAIDFADDVHLDGVVEKITVPFLIAHGENDRQIPLEYAHRSYEQAVNSPKRELRVFTPEQLAGASTRFRIEQDLRRAIEREEFELFFQPELSVCNFETHLVEALIRWRKPDGSYIPPGEFLSVAEIDTSERAAARVGTEGLAGEVVDRDPNQSQYRALPSILA